MHASAFFRLVWKDTRAQFGLWCALVIGALLLQTLVIVAAGAPRNPASALEVVSAVAFILTACFIVAGLAMLFAGESEEGTRDWLQQLPIPPLTLVSAKLSLAVVSTALFLAATCASGLVIAVIAGHSLENLLKADVFQYQKSLAGAFAWGLLFSLLLRRVMHVLLAAVAAEIVTVAVTDNVVGPYLAELAGRHSADDVMRVQVYLSVIAVILLVDLVLAYRWARVGGTVAVAARRRRLTSLSLPGAERRAQAWLNRVAWASRRGSPESRATAVLVWREARALVPFAGLWIVLGFVATDLPQLLGSSRQWLAHSPFPILFLIATPVVCGLLTCMGDQRQQVYRFLGERGVSPARVWCVKQLVWFTAAVLLCLLFIRWDSTAVERLRQYGQSSVSLFMLTIRSLHVPGATPDRGYCRPEDTALQLRFLWALLGALFAAGQCASFWIRRPILAFGLMLIVVPVLVGWHYALAMLDVPFWIGSWPLTFALLAATLSSANAWLRGRDSWKLRLTRLAAVALPVGAVALAAAAHRAFSVPSPVFDSHVAIAINAREIAIHSPNPEWSTRWNVVLRNFPQTAHAASLPLQYSGDAVATRERLLVLGQELEAGNGRRHLNPLLLSPDRPVSVQVIARFLTQPVAVALDDRAALADAPMMALQEGGLGGDAMRLETRPATIPAPTIDEEWQRCEAGLRITRYLAEQSQSAAQWGDCILAHGTLQAAIRRWARRTDQTPESLQHAFEFLASDAASPVMTPDMFVNRHVFYTDLLNRRGRKWEQLVADRTSRFDGIDPSIAGAWLPWFERQRAIRVLGHLTNESLSGHGSFMDAFHQRGETLRRWEGSTNGLPGNVIGETYSRDLSGRPMPGSIDAWFQRALSQRAATALIVALQRHRLQHGSFPPSLMDALPSQFAFLSVDAYSSVPFGYEPEGLSADLYLPSGIVIPAGQPLLWTPGSMLARLARSAQPVAASVADAFEIPAGVFYIRPVALRKADPDVRRLAPAKMLFLDLSSLEFDQPPAKTTPAGAGSLPPESVRAESVPDAVQRA